MVIRLADPGVDASAVTEIYRPAVEAPHISLEEIPNPVSEALHRSIGMKRVGVYEGVGLRLGRWWDVAWYGARLIDPDWTTSEPVPLPLLR